MALQDQLLKYVKYGLTMRTSTSNGVPYYIVSLTYNPKWSVVEPTDGEVSCLPSSENKPGVYFYFTPVMHGINPLFEAIEETVEFNEELEKKAELLKNKVQELQQLFMSEPYEKLVNLQFTFPTEPAKRGRKPGKGKKTESEEPTEPKIEPQPMPEETVLNADVENIPEPIKEEIGEVNKPEPGANKEEANDIDAKIAAALGKARI